MQHVLGALQTSSDKRQEQSLTRSIVAAGAMGRSKALDPHNLAATRVHVFRDAANRLRYLKIYQAVKPE